MYLSELRLWNFRKYGCDDDDLDKIAPAVCVHFNPNLNVLIGENDSGKTAIVDSIRLLLGTQSREWYRLEPSDFYGLGKKRRSKLKIEGILRGFTNQEAAQFLEWIGFEENNGKQDYVLTVRLIAEQKGSKIFTDFRAGPDNIGTQMDGGAKELLRITYLKPLRDAESELTPGRRSRFAQILSAHKLFHVLEPDKTHKLEIILKDANSKIRDYFSKKSEDGFEVMRRIDDLLKEFFPEGTTEKASINISGGELSDILRKLELSFTDNPAGLGTLNLLYIAAELLLLQSDDFQGLRLGIIEELEAHLHPQAQLRLIDFLKKEAANNGCGQFILTTHSTTLGAGIELESLIICKGNKTFPLAPKFTKLEPKNYAFLHRFLDATKANLFFARGVILVEGDAENILLPALAEIIDRPLHRYGVSIVNVGSVAFLHYAKIFQRQDGQNMNIPVSVITDMDVKPLEWKDDEGKSLTEEEIESKKGRKNEWAETIRHENVRVFLSPNWTLEYEIALEPAFSYLLYRAALIAVKISNSKTGNPSDGKIEKAEQQAIIEYKKFVKEHSMDSRVREKIAFFIYKETMLNKKISKPTVAQLLTEKISEIRTKGKGKLKEAVLNSVSLRYIVDAIYHVTESEV